MRSINLTYHLLLIHLESKYSEVETPTVSARMVYGKTTADVPFLSDLQAQQQQRRHSHHPVSSTSLTHCSKFPTSKTTGYVDIFVNFKFSEWIGNDDVLTLFEQMHRQRRRT